jgi:hypothetical protein
MAAFGRRTTQKNKQKGQTVSRERAPLKKSISIQTNESRQIQENTNALQKKVEQSLLKLTPILEEKITKELEAKYFIKIRPLEKEIKRLREEKSSLLYRNGLPTIQESENNSNQDQIDISLVNNKLNKLLDLLNVDDPNTNIIMTFKQLNVRLDNLIESLETKKKKKKQRNEEMRRAQSIADEYRSARLNSMYAM